MKSSINRDKAAEVTNMSLQCLSFVLFGATLSMTQLTHGFVAPGGISAAVARETLSRSASKVGARVEIFFGVRESH